MFKFFCAVVIVWIRLATRTNVIAFSDPFPNAGRSGEKSPDAVFRKVASGLALHGNRRNLIPCRFCDHYLHPDRRPAGQPVQQRKGQS